MAKVDSSKLTHTSSYSYYKTDLHERPIFHYTLVILVIATLVTSLYTLYYANQLKKALIPQTVTVQDFLKKLTDHSEMKAYVGVAPLNIVQITNNNFANLQSQISGLEASYVGNFIVQYTDRVVVYDYDKDQVRGSVTLQLPQQGQLPTDFFTKLNRHAELKGLENQKPVGGQFDDASLNTLKQQFPDVYKDAKVGDFLLRYKSKLVIYDYSADKIINVVNLA